MKGQIEFGETIMVVIVLVFFLAIGFIFYYSISEKNVMDQVFYREDVDNIVLGKRVLALPEIECPLAQDRPCIDYWKASYLGDITSGEYMGLEEVGEYYGALFGYATITLYPVDGFDPVVLYERKLTGDFSVSTQFLFTNIYETVTGEMQLAYLNITRYGVIR